MPKKSHKHQLNAIQPGYQLLWYEIREILGQGGFGITYLAVDRNLAHEVAIKEYMPVDLATRTVEGSVAPLAPDREQAYRWGLERFLDEARTIGQFKHPNIVRVRNVFEANNTAYMVMDYELGETLQEILSRRKVLDEEDVATVVFPIIDGMKHVHAHGFIHRDIKPGNIFIRVDGDPVLLDFGSARQAVEQSRGSLTSIFSKGYAPIEQYNNQEEQGPWTDIYAFGATMYRAIAGVPPADAIDRSSAISVAGHDTYVSAVEIGAGRYSQSLLEAIDSAMKFRRHERPQSISELQAVLHGQKGAESPITATVPITDAAPTPRTSPSESATEQELEVESPPVDERLAKMIEFAEGGDAEAQCELAFMYAKGIDMPQSEARALQWYTLAAEQGHAGAQFSLGVMYAKGRSVEQDYEQAFNWYRKAAEQGHVGAQATLATMYTKGVGTERDTKAAFDWHLRAAKRGHANSMFTVGEMYFHGTGVQQNLEEAFLWYRKAAEKGHVHAQINLGFMYGKGQGVVRNDRESAQWYRKAAESGNPNAQYNLGVIYSKGRGISRDLDEARKWYSLAAAQGEANAERALARMNGL
ncbi:MAG: SEL1-like repeat protein [Gammaproteobacteria bacterium]|nr:SEL1-like repeat protein [Gammaproteobacteria bacterium]